MEQYSWYTSGLFYYCAKCLHVQMNSKQCLNCDNSKLLWHTIPKHIPQKQYELYLEEFMGRLEKELV